MNSISSQGSSSESESQWMRLESMITMHNQETINNSTTQTASARASDIMHAQAAEYEEEAMRLRELLALSGLDPLTLDHTLGPSLLSIASLASELGLSGSLSSSLELSASLAWGQLALDDISCTSRLFALKKRRGEITRCLKRAQGGMKDLDSSLEDAASRLSQSDHQLSQQVLPYYREIPSKEIKYKDIARQFREELKGVSLPLGLMGQGGDAVKNEVKHYALVGLHEELEVAQGVLKEAHLKLEAFHGLPATQHGAELLLAQARQNTESTQRLLHNALGLQQ